MVQNEGRLNDFICVPVMYVIGLPPLSMTLHVVCRNRANDDLDRAVALMGRPKPANRLITRVSGEIFGLP